MMQGPANIKGVNSINVQRKWFRIRNWLFFFT